jgi:hypothetical protein
MRAMGLSVVAAGHQLQVSPKALITDEVRKMIRNEREIILRQLGQEEWRAGAQAYALVAKVMQRTLGRP